MMSDLQGEQDTIPKSDNCNIMETDKNSDEVQTQTSSKTEAALEGGEDEEQTVAQQDLKMETDTSAVPPLFIEDQQTGPSSLTSETGVSPSVNDMGHSHNDVSNSTASVKILLMPEGHMMTMAFTIGLTIQELKNHFANELKIPSGVIQITLNGETIEDHQTLLSLGVQPLATVQFEMSSLDPDNYPIKRVKPQQECNMSDVITVRMQTDEGTYQDAVVEIERAPQRKDFLGGYRHKVTKVEYHHATMQTVPEKRPDRGLDMFSRDTQTVKVKSQAQQCNIKTSTQMTTTGCYISKMYDKFITPGIYVTADEYHSKRLEAVIIIQKYYRRWLAKQWTAQIRLKRELYLAWIESEKQRKIEEREEKIWSDYYRMMNPEKKEDFALLFSALDKWMQKELEKINATMSGAERKAALCGLLEQEAQYISSIERHRLVAEEKKQPKAEQDFLNKCAASKKWRRKSDGKMIQMDTMEIIRAKHLRDLYYSFTLYYPNIEERLDVLHTIKYTIQEQKCKLTEEIVALIDQEADLLTRGVKESNLVGLRKRIATLLLQYFKTPTFNPQVARYLRVPQDLAGLKKNIYYCRGCSKYLPSTDFALTVNDRVVGVCQHCKELDSEARNREDISHYKTILKLLRKNETECNPDAKIPYVLQVQDLQYLVSVIWRTRSAQSSSNDLYDLLMVRWDKSCEWTPWNCILLTKDEAAAHLKVKDMEKVYSMVFICNIEYKHTLARRYFSQIPLMAEYLHDVDS